jgi:hypothetical protein
MSVTSLAREHLDLAGTWRFALDRDDVGAAEGWATRTLPHEVTLPGSIQEQGIGEPPSEQTQWIGFGGKRVDAWNADPRTARYRERGRYHFPFALTPTRRYIGLAWFERDVEIPPAWEGRRVVLHLERPHWRTRVFIDGRLLGEQDSLSTPHEYELLASAVPGSHRLVVRVDNRILDVKPGENSHSISDHTQTNWNGIVGRIELRTTPAVWIDHVEVHASATQRSLARVTIGNATGADVAVSIGIGPAAVRVTAAAGRSTHEVGVPLAATAATWDEFSPALHEIDVKMQAVGRDERDARPVRFGLRDLAIDGTRFTLNGRPIQFRGTLECCIFPLTGYPPTDVESWRRIVRICKAHGLNHIRFHSWCPPRAAFVAADELGFYYQVECASWANMDSSLGDGAPIDGWLYAEAERILRAYGNHPSFVLMAYGNEPGGEKQKEYLGRFVRHFRQRDPRRKYTSGAGWPVIPENDFHSIYEPRIQLWGAGLGSRINGKPPETLSDYRDFVQKFDRPFITHEIGQWCAYPNFEEMPKYRGSLEPRNYEVFRDTLARNHLLELAPRFVRASGKLQTLCYKEEIESALRTEGFGGFQLLDLHDFPGQGTATVGVLDAFWESKGYVTADEFRRFCGPTVPLARLPGRIFRSSDTLQARLQLAHFGAADLPDAVVSWTLRDGRWLIASGRIQAGRLETGRLHDLGSITVPLGDVSAPGRVRLEVRVDQTPHVNDWDLWVYPDTLSAPEPGSVHECRRLDETAVERLRAGAAVVLFAAPADVRGDALGKVELGFSPIFWNTAWTDRQAPHTLGILCDPQHPALREFPTDDHTDWQWWEPIHCAAAFVLDRLPPMLRPIVQVIDDWFTNRRLAMVFEARIGAGRILVAGMDADGDLDDRPSLRQLRHSLLQYARSDRFRPEVELTLEQLRSLFAEQAVAPPGS